MTAPAAASALLRPPGEPIAEHDAGAITLGGTSSMLARRLVSYEDAARYLGGIPTSTLRTWVQREQIPHLRLAPKCVRFDLDAIDAWLASKRRGPGGGL